MSSTTANAKPSQAATAGKPVDVLSGQAAQLFANLHPVLLLSLVPISFTSLVRDPVSTLLGLAPTTLLLQALYCVVCLPSTGQVPPPKIKPGQKAKPVKSSPDIWARLVVWSLSVILPT
jgi:phosphatidylinositol glycan class F